MGLGSVPYVIACVGPDDDTVEERVGYYGENQGKERKSKTYDQVTTGNIDKPYWFNFGVEMALLAPTAINQQKFEIGLNEDGSVSFTDRGGIHSKTDLGIVKYHFEVGAEYVKGKANGV